MYPEQVSTCSGFLLRFLNRLAVLVEQLARAFRRLAGDILHRNALPRVLRKAGLLIRDLEIPDEAVVDHHALGTVSYPGPSPLRRCARLSEQLLLPPFLQRKCHRIAVQLLQHIEKSPEGWPVVILVGAEDAGKALLAVEWDPRKLAAVVVQKARRKANTASGCHVGQCGVVVGAVEIAYLPGGDQPVLDRLQGRE